MAGVVAGVAGAVRTSRPLDALIPCDWRKSGCDSQRSDSLFSTPSCEAIESTCFLLSAMAAGQLGSWRGCVCSSGSRVCSSSSAGRADNRGSKMTNAVSAGLRRILPCPLALFVGSVPPAGKAPLPLPSTLASFSGKAPPKKGLRSRIGKAPRARGSAERKSLDVFSIHRKTPLPLCFHPLHGSGSWWACRPVFFPSRCGRLYSLSADTLPPRTRCVFLSAPPRAWPRGNGPTCGYRPR